MNHAQEPGHDALRSETHDAVDCRETQRALRESEARLRSLLEHLPDLVCVVDRDAKIYFANRDFQNIPRESLIGMAGLELAAPEAREIVRRGLEDAFDSGRPQGIEVRDVFDQWWSVRMVTLGGETADDRALVIATDVTQQRLAAEAIEKEQRLLRQLLDVHERERQLIAYDIHDGFAQQLTGSLFRLQAFRETLDVKPEEAWKAFDVAARLLRQAIDETRRLISGLRPPVLDEQGIVEAIEYLICEHHEAGGPEIKFQHDMPAERLTPPLESAVFRIVQESLQNACRHSGSRRIHVSLAHRGGQLHIGVRDWGVGFRPNDVSEQRFGLQGIRERVRLLDGQTTIESKPDEGTHVRVELPLP